MIEEFQENVISGLWLSGECFAYTTAKGRLCYLIGNKVQVQAHVDKKFFLLGYISSQNRLYLINKSLTMVSYQVLTSVLNFQTAIIREEHKKARELLKNVPDSMLGKLAKFLESCDCKEFAFEIAPDADHKFDLAIQLNRIVDAYEIAEAQGNAEKYKRVGDIALSRGDFDLAERCFGKCEDFHSLLLLHSSLGNEEGVKFVAEESRAKGKFNIAFTSFHCLVTLF